MYDLLNDPIFEFDSESGRERSSLPVLLAALGQGKARVLQGLQRHQDDPFHVFLCYLAGAVLMRAGSSELAQSAEFWQQGLLALGGSNPNAWRLLVEDPTQPAFMQPPLPSPESVKFLKPKAATPDELDLLQTAKNHDVKSQRAAAGDLASDWVFALVSLQTMSGFMGKGNYGIARMNGGFGSRPIVSIVTGQDAARRWREDTLRLLNLRNDLLAGPWEYQQTGLVLLWTVPWDLNTSLPLAALDPFFIEVSRVVRLIRSATSLSALGAPTMRPRIAATETKGVLGDPWVPIKDGEKALTVSPEGLTAKLLRDILFEDGYTPAAMQRVQPGPTACAHSFRVSVLVGGQGRTDGFHQAAIPIPAPAARLLFNKGAGRDQLADVSKIGLSDAGAMQNKVLAPALLSFLEAGPTQINFDKRETNAWRQQAVAAFQAAWGNEFFPWLWSIAEQSDVAQARLLWLHSLRAAALAVFDDAVARFPQRAGRCYRGRVRARGLFYGCLFKAFPELREDSHDAASAI